jgi:hypothetical protein
MPPVGFEPTIAVLERAKTVRALDRAATAIGQLTFEEWNEGIPERQNQWALTSSKNKNIRHLYRGKNAFKGGYQPRNNLVKDENGYFLTNSHNILNSLVM